MTETLTQKALLRSKIRTSAVTFESHGAFHVEQMNHSNWQKHIHS